MWGRVLDEKAAARANRCYLVSLGNNCGRGPELYIDGTGVANVLASDSCIGWLIAPLPSPKKDVNGNEAGAGAAPPKIAKKVNNKESGEGKAGKTETQKKNEKKPLVATHKIEVIPFTITLGNGETIYYDAPMIVDNPEHQDVVQQPLHRARTELDDRDMGSLKPKTPECQGFAAQ